MNLFEKKYTCRSLNYSVATLSMAMGLILLGFFCYTLTTNIVDQIIPLRLKELGASAKTIAFIMTTVGGIFNMTICPAVSFKSDRFRSRWGRRIPFILGTLPMFCGAIVLFGLSSWLGDILHPLVSRWISISPTTLVVTLIGIIMAVYKFFFMFVGSVIFYIYNDVIPSQYLARIVGLVQVANTLATSLFNFFIFKYSLSHFKWVMFLAAIIYATGLGCMCFLLKEPEYPPVEEKQQKESQGIRGVCTFMKESFSHPLYLYKFLGEAFVSVGMVISPFVIFFKQDMGLTLEQVGNLNGYAGVSQTCMGMVAAVFLTILVDRWHPVRVKTFVSIFLLFPIISNLKWIWVSPPSQVFWWILLINGITGCFISLYNGIAGMPCLMRLYPQSRFGQFCSAAAMLRSIAVIVFGYLVGIYIDVLKDFCGFGERAFRMIYIWQFLWHAVGVFFLAQSYRWWKRMGGENAYAAPAPWSKEKFEKMPVTPVIPANPKYLRLNLGILSALFGGMFLGAVALFGFAKMNSQETEAGQYLLRAIPCSAVAAAYWLFVLKGILRDLKLASQGLPPVNGLPHHGILMILAVYQIGVLVTVFLQSILTLRDGAGISATLWAMEALCTIPVAFSVWWIAKMEK